MSFPRDAVLIAFFVEDVPITDASEQLANVYVVKVIQRVNPVAAAIVNLKVKILRPNIFLDAG